MAASDAPAAYAATVVGLSGMGNCYQAMLDIVLKSLQRFRTNEQSARQALSGLGSNGGMRSFVLQPEAARRHPQRNCVRVASSQE